MRTLSVAFLLFLVQSNLRLSIASNGLFMIYDFKSSWIILNNNNFGSATTTVNHGLGEVPLLVDVMVKVTDGDNNQYIFPATGIQIRDDDDNTQWGGGTYRYDDTAVYVSVPHPSNGVLGKAAYAQSGDYWYGPNSQSSNSAQIQVRAWKSSSLPTPDYTATGISVTAQGSISETYVERFHGLGEAPVLTVARITDPNTGFYYDTIGANVFTQTIIYQRNGYSIFGISDIKLRFWAASDTYGCLYAGGDGIGWDVCVSTANLEIYAWKEASLNPNVSTTYQIGAVTTGFAKSVSDLSSDVEETYTKVWAQATSGANNGLRFVGGGSLAYRTSSSVNPCSYGGLTYTYTSTNAQATSGANNGLMFVGGGALAYRTSSSVNPCSYGGLTYAYTSTNAQATSGANNGLMFVGGGALAYRTSSSVNPCGYGGLTYAYTSTNAQATSGANNGLMFVGSGALAYRTSSSVNPCSYGGLTYAYTSMNAQATSGANNGLMFVGGGALAYRTSSSVNPCSYGGLTYAYTSTNVRFWKPKESWGHLICIGDNMGNGVNSQGSDDGIAVIKKWALDTNECLTGVCKNGATCTNYAWGYTCDCVAGWTGTNCDTDIDECANTPCQNGATCNNLLNYYTCTCAAGWTSMNCDANIDECASNPCQNGATCNNLLNMYNCTCAPGYVDYDCQTDFDECASDPCFNGATCTDYVNQYNCKCSSGWTGTLCNEEIKECDSSPCQNGAACVDGPGIYVCRCPQGWSGVTCNTDVDECILYSPCLNSGTCTNSDGSYECACAEGYAGQACQTPVNGSDVQAISILGLLSTLLYSLILNNLH